MPAVHTSQDARLNGRIGGLTYAANTPPDELRRRGRLAHAAKMARYEQEADPDGALPPHIRRRRAELRLRVEMAKLSARAVRKRRARPVVDGPGPSHPGQFRTGANNPAVRHDDETVRRAIELRAQGLPLRSIGEELGADHGTIGRWLRGATRRGAVR